MKGGHVSILSEVLQNRTKTNNQQATFDLLKSRSFAGNTLRSFIVLWHKLA
jgi:hypothetical protein